MAYKVIPFFKKIFVTLDSVMKFDYENTPVYVVLLALVKKYKQRSKVK